jgi:hypothetical protein
LAKNQNTEALTNEAEKVTTTEDTVEAANSVIGMLESMGVVSYPSTPVTLINIPEPMKVTGKFKYNYYVKDERTNGSGNLTVIDKSNASQEEIGKIKSGKMPRFVKISVSAAKFDLEDKMLKGMAERLGPNLISKYVKDLLFEGGVSNGYFSGLHLQDDQVDQSFYYALSSSIAFFGAEGGDPSTLNTKEQYDKYNRNFKREGYTRPSGLTIRDALSNIQAKGFSYAPTDVRNEISNDALRSVRFIDYDLNINNKFIWNTLMGAVEDKTNIYQDEISSVIDVAQQIQTESVYMYNSNSVSADEFNIELDAIETIVVNAIPEADNAAFPTPDYNESSYPIGFYIEKIEIATVDADSGLWTRIDHPPLIVNSYGNLKLLDTAVKYGSTYVYNVKTVCLTRFEGIRRDEGSKVEDQVVIGISMIASEGTLVKVQCQEKIPPSPPRSLKPHWDYRTNTLMIFWEEPRNPQRDIVRYQIFRRKSINLPFTLVAELDFDESTSRVEPVETANESKIIKVGGPRKYFRDLAFTMDSDYIYAVACVDARGFTSNYSAQFRVTFSRSKNKIQTELISRFDAPKPYPNVYLNADLFQDTMRDSGHSRMRVFFDPDFYKLQKTKTSTFYKLGRPIVIKREQELDYIGDSYKFQVINVDDQLSNVIDIKISDLTGPPLEVPVNEADITTAIKITELPTELEGDGILGKSEYLDAFYGYDSD